MHPCVHIKASACVRLCSCVCLYVSLYVCAYLRLRMKDASVCACMRLCLDGPALQQRHTAGDRCSDGASGRTVSGRAVGEGFSS
jgi:hypothetical protein